MIRCSISNKIIREGDRVHVVILHRNMERASEHTSVNFENDYDYQPVSLPLAGVFKGIDEVYFDTATAIARDTFIATFPTYSLKHIVDNHERRMLATGVREHGFSIKEFANEVARGEHENFTLQFVASEIYKEIISENTEYYHNSPEADSLIGEVYDYIDNEVIPYGIKDYRMDVIVDKRLQVSTSPSSPIEGSVFRAIEDMPQFDVFTRSVFGTTMCAEYVITPLLWNLIDRESDYFTPYYEADALVRIMREMGVSYGKPTFVKRSYNYELEYKIREIAMDGDFIPAVN